MSGELRVAVIGTGFMGRMHAHAWRAAHRFFDLPNRPVLELLVGRDADRTAAAAEIAKHLRHCRTALFGSPFFFPPPRPARLHSRSVSGSPCRAEFPTWSRIIAALLP